MRFSGFRALLGLSDLAAQVLLERDYRAYFRLQFLYGAQCSGLLPALLRSATVVEVAARTGAERLELLEAFLDLGVAVGELSRDGGRFRIRGRRAKALASVDGDATAAMIQEYVTLHNSAFRDLPGTLTGADLGHYLDGAGEVIARSSRLLEPFVAPFVKEIVAQRKPRRLLEIGCGSGAYLRRATEASSEITGVAVEMQADVAQQARSNLRSWGLADRFHVVTADVLDSSLDLPGPFDLVTLYNNIYYFLPEVRPRLYSAVLGWLASGGAAILVTGARGDTVTVASFDFFLASLDGCTRLQSPKELTEELGRHGFRTVERVRLAPVHPLFAFVAEP